MGEKTFNLRNAPLTMVQFMDNIDHGILACIECGCGYRSFTPFSHCPQCGKLSREHAKWQEVKGEAKVQTYCVVYVPPPALSDMVPYCSMIVSFGKGLNVSAILDRKLDPLHPPRDLIGKSVKPSFIPRGENHSILAMKLVE